MDNKRLSTLLKLISNPERLNILFLLLDGEHSINELSEVINQPVPVVSTHLAKLRSEGIVDFTRYHRVLAYRLTSDEMATILNTLRHLQSTPAAA